MKKLLLIPAFAALSLLAACNSATVPTNTSDDDSAMASSAAMMDDDNGIMDSSSEAATMEDDSSATTQTSSAATEVTSSSTQAVSMTVGNFEFAPNTVTFKKGQKAVIHLTDTTGIHGFGVKDLGINVRISPGDTVDVTIPTDKTGTFHFRCTVPCGPGHESMTGTIVIK